MVEHRYSFPEEEVRIPRRLQKEAYILRVGFYGHSAACWSGSNNESFIDILKDEFEVDCRGVPQGSEGRILSELKSSKIDAAIIFHSLPRYLYLPRCTRDISLQQVKAAKADQLWSENDNDSPDVEFFENEFFSYGRIKEVFETRENFLYTVNSYKKYLWTNENMKDIFCGFMMQIDSYLEQKNIKAIHSVIWKPPWLNIRSGPVDDELFEISKKYVDYNFNNNISLEGNRIMAEKLRAFLHSH